MAYLQKRDLAVKQDNIDLVMMAMIDVALELLADPATDAQLAAYAAGALNSPASYAKRMAFGAVFLAMSTNDEAVKAAVEAIFPAYAGVQAVA